MKNISKVKISVYFFNAYSNLNPNSLFISGSDRVGLKFLDFENKAVVIAPETFKELLPSQVEFISSDSTYFLNLHFRYLIRTIKSIVLLFKLNKNYEIERIVSTSDFYPDTLPCFLNSQNTKWYAFTYHLYPLKFSFRDIAGRLLQLISFCMFNKSYKVITTSSDCENFLKKNFRNLSILKIPLGIDYKSYKTSQPKEDCLIYLGRFKESKGVFYLPEIMFKITQKYPKCNLNIIGNGDFESVKKLETLIKEFRLEEKIKILKNLSDTEVLVELKKSKILLQPSHEEGFGLSILEALASNLKVVAYNLPVYQEHFSEFNLNLVPLGDLEAFSTQTILLLKNNQNSTYPSNYFEKFSWSSIYKKIFKD